MRALDDIQLILIFSHASRFTFGVLETARDASLRYWAILPSSASICAVRLDEMKSLIFTEMILI